MIQSRKNGCIAQLARACGSYPQCHWFKSNYSHQYGPVVKRPKTPPFHGGNTGSNPVRVTINKTPSKRMGFYLCSSDRGRTRECRRRRSKTAIGFALCQSLEYGKRFWAPLAAVKILPNAEYPVRFYINGLGSAKHPLKRAGVSFYSFSITVILCINFFLPFLRSLTMPVRSSIFSVVSI